MRSRPGAGVPAGAKIGRPACTAVLALPGARLAYEVTGAGPAVVLVHGFGLDMRMWDPQAAHLAARFRVVRYDGRGFGASGPFDPAVPYTHAGDLLALLDHLAIDDAVLAGLSFGGRVVTQAALSAPDRIAAWRCWTRCSMASRGTRPRPRLRRGGPAGPGPRVAGRPGGLAGAPAVRRRPPAPAAGRSARGHDGRLPGAALARPGPAPAGRARADRHPGEAGRAGPGAGRRTRRAVLQGDVCRARPPHPGRPVPRGPRRWPHDQHGAARPVNELLASFLADLTFDPAVMATAGINDPDGRPR